MKTKKSIIHSCYFLSGLLFVSSDSLIGQVTIHLDNPSFEDNPRAGTAYTPIIKGWQDCGHEMFPEETPPDIHPVPTKAWEVGMKAYDGNTYIGIVVRYNNTYESVSQKLEKPLEENKCYSLSAFLARSDAYKSLTRRSAIGENFISPAVLRIWGGNESCERLELIAQSEPVDHSVWKQYSFELLPKENLTYITIEAFYADLTTKAYNGHVLVDNLSPIVEVGCH